MGLVDRYIIEHFLGLHSVGLYIGAHDLTTQIMAATTSVLVSRFYLLARWLLKHKGCQGIQRDIFQNMAVFMLLAIFVLTAMCLIFAPITYPRLLAQEAQEAADAFYSLDYLGNWYTCCKYNLVFDCLNVAKTYDGNIHGKHSFPDHERHLQYVAGALAELPEQLFPLF